MRSEFESDRDKLLYSTAFRRLNAVSQVALSVEGGLLHNRLFHSIKVSTVAGGIAVKLQRQASQENRVELLEKFGGVDRFSTEAGALAHDLGHPPFGHAGERALCACVDQAMIDAGYPENTSSGYEGNAQSFRIVTKLALIKPDYNGLNLSRATLNALQKYPWARELNPVKWGIYDEGLDEEPDYSDPKLLEWAREHVDIGFRRTIEAQIVDIADDISFAVHDLEDWLRANYLNPTDLERMLKGQKEAPADGILKDVYDREYRRMRYIEGWLIASDSSKSYQGNSSGEHGPDPGVYEEVADRILARLPNWTAFEGRSDQRFSLRSFTSNLLGDILGGVELSDEFGAQLSPASECAVVILKHVTKTLVHQSPVILRQQMGERRVVETLFGAFLAACEAGHYNVLPPAFREAARKYRPSPTERSINRQMIRVASDSVASLTEDAAIRIADQVGGGGLGSIYFRSEE